MKTTIIGLGLIGGSIAIDLRAFGIASTITGVDANETHARIAREIGLVDEVVPLADALHRADLVILAVPVDAICELLPDLLDAIPPNATVIDTGSTKAAICDAVASHPRRACFVAAHPIAGTENSGPRAALAGLFRSHTNIVCESDRSANDSLAVAARVFDALGLQTTFMSPAEHDLHVAYVSHLSHVTSFVLGQTVLDIESDESNIFMLAGSGLESTVRLAKSSPEMWAPIFEQNAAPLAKALDEYAEHLDRFRRALAARDATALHEIMTRANEIRRVLDGIGARRTAPSNDQQTRPPLCAEATIQSAIHGGTQ